MDHEDSVDYILSILAEKMPTKLENYVCWSVDVQSQMLDFMASYGLLEVFLNDLDDDTMKYIFHLSSCIVSVQEAENALDAAIRLYEGRDEEPPQSRPRIQPSR